MSLIRVSGENMTSVGPEKLRNIWKIAAGIENDRKKKQKNNLLTFSKWVAGDKSTYFPLTFHVHHSSDSHHLHSSIQLDGLFFIWNNDSCHIIGIREVCHFHSHFIVQSLPHGCTWVHFHKIDNPPAGRDSKYLWKLPVTPHRIMPEIY